MRVRERAPRISGATWVTAARAAVAEGYVAAIVERSRDDVMQSWEFPSCVVPLGRDAIAVAAGHPSDDDEVLANWAGRVAHGAARMGARRAVISGGARARAAVADALALVGIDVTPEAVPGGRERGAR